MNLIRVLKSKFSRTAAAMVVMCIAAAIGISSSVIVYAASSNITVREEKREVIIPLNIIQVEDPDMYTTDGEIVTVQGERGLAIVTEKVTEVDGQETARERVSYQEIVPAGDKIITVGTKEPPEIIVDDNGNVAYTGEGSYFIWPYDGMITSYFGYRSVSVGTSNHQGIDINASYGNPVVAARSGVVTSETGWGEGYGYCVYIDHGDGMESLYAHNSQLLVSEGDYVEEGQVIAYAGSTGWSSGTHVHFEVRYEGTPINPLDFLPSDAE